MPLGPTTITSVALSSLAPAASCVSSLVPLPVMVTFFDEMVHGVGREHDRGVSAFQRHLAGRLDQYLALVEFELRGLWSASL
jgi:hypothetical protein